MIVNYVSYREQIAMTCFFILPEFLEEQQTISTTPREVIVCWYSPRVANILVKLWFFDNYILSLFQIFVSITIFFDGKPIKTQ